MQHLFLEINNYLVAIYLLVLLASIFIFKEFNSHTLSALLMLTFEIIMRLAENPIYDFILTLGVHFGRLFWFGFWSVFNILFVRIIYYLHDRLSLKKGRASRLVTKALMLFVVIHILGYFDAYFIRTEFSEICFLALKAAGQIAIILVLLYDLGNKSYKEVAFSKAAHNRSVNWYQQIMKLPVEQRPIELLKWREFTENLETNNNIMRIK